MRISVIGLGKLGAPLAAVLAECGHDVVGVDNRADAVELVNAGRPPIEEQGLAEVIARNRGRLRATVDLGAAVAETDVTFVIVPTPSTAEGGFSTELVRLVIRGMGEALRRKTAYHVVAITSTVAPGAMDEEIRPTLEQASGRIVGESIGLCYNPEFVALGSVIRDTRNPDFVLIGESDRRAGDIVASIQRTIVGEAVEIQRMNFVNAEICKIAVNTFVTTKISYANMLAEICERMHGGDVDVVTAAIGLDRRIGRQYFRGTLGYGGPCFPRDNLAFAAVARHRGARADLALATDSINRHQIERLAALVRAHSDSARTRIGILGLSYKPDTPVVDSSQGLMLANRLDSEGSEVIVFDPQGLPAARRLLARSIRVADSVAAVVAAADVVVITTPWQSFADLPACLSETRSHPPTIIDCWRLLRREDVGDRARLVYPGQGPVAEPVAVPFGVSSEV